jgi:hypothetical protein
MRRLMIGIILFLLLSGKAWADLDIPPVTYPKLVRQGAATEAFVPKGWKLEAQQKGDLNKDGVDDLLILLRMDEAKNIIKNEGFGPNLFDTNPRILAVAFGARAKPYRLALESHTLITRPTVPTLEDILTENGGITIENGTLKVALNVFQSAGSWSTWLSTFRFRHGKRGFELIGFERRTLQRNSGEVSEVSINYLTGKASIGTGTIEDDKLNVKWRKLRKQRLILIDEIADGLEFEPRY